MNIFRFALSTLVLFAVPAACSRPKPPPSISFACGGGTYVLCRSNLYCEYPAEQPCGSGGQVGVCKPKPQACPFVLTPVCGCDGKTYSNDCLANAAGMSVARKGACTTPPPPPPPPGACGGPAKLSCSADEYCLYGPHCGAAGELGICQSKPGSVICTQQYVPVCGCDGKTYPNACAASGAGMSIAASGECAVP